MFVVIEGIDGSGKGTVTRALSDRLIDEGVIVDTVSFPRYTDNLYGGIVGRYLNGEFGESTHPYLHGTLYSVDRFESKPFIEAALSYNDVVIADRYVPSNLCYSALKCKSEEEADEVCRSFVRLEYEIFGLPVPDVIFFLDVPVKFAVQNIAKKAARDYTDQPADIYEADEQYLSKVRRFYRAKLMGVHPPTRFEPVECVRNGHLISIDSVVEKVHNVLTQMRKGDFNGTTEA